MKRYIRMREKKIEKSILPIPIQNYISFHTTQQYKYKYKERVEQLATRVFP